MLGLLHSKLFAVTPPAAIIDNAGVTTAAIDTQGFGWVTVIVFLGATDIAMTALKVQESDVSGSGYADVTGLIFGTSTTVDGTASALPSATNDNGFFTFEINTTGRKRYLKVSATAGDGSAGTYVTMLAALHNGLAGIANATQRGVVGTLAV